MSTIFPESHLKTVLKIHLREGEGETPKYILVKEFQMNLIQKEHL